MDEETKRYGRFFADSEEFVFSKRVKKIEFNLRDSDEEE